jgi:transcriptional regulator with XRE-family HTH domain
MKIDRLTPTGATLVELGQRLARIRKQQGLSQEHLAAAAGIGVATLRRIEDGKDGKLGSWLRLLQALQMDGAIDNLLPADFRSPLAEVTRRRQRKPKASPPDAAGGSGTGFVWGDERP